MVKSGWKESGIRMRPALALSSLVCILGTALAQEPAPIRVDVRLVRVVAGVTDRNEAPVGSLEKTNFEVRDNGVLQQISLFERQTEQPLSIAVLIDDSGQILWRGEGYDPGKMRELEFEIRKRLSLERR